jgi:hypothetical protein
MILNGASGRMWTASGVAPAGASHLDNAAPLPESSMLMRGTLVVSVLAATVFATGSVRKKSFAPQSASMVSKESGVAEGGSGATATPARNAPRNTDAYSTFAAPLIAITSPLRRPSRCTAAAMRSISAFNSP